MCPIYFDLMSKFLETIDSYTNVHTDKKYFCGWITAGNDDMAEN